MQYLYMQAIRRAEIKRSVIRNNTRRVILNIFKTHHINFMSDKLFSLIIKKSNPGVILGRENHKGSLDMEFPCTSSLAEANSEPALFT